MSYTSVQTKTAFTRLKFFLALSRTPHALLDLAAPALSAALWMGALPSWGKIGLGLLTAFSGYLSVYALNDVVDYRGDLRKLRRKGLQSITKDLDSFLLLHPMAHGSLTLREGFSWMVGWGLLALLGSYLLNPICTVIFLIACLLEVIYCRLLQITSLRGVVSGIVKNSGGVAAVFAVDPHPSPLFLVVLFLWFFFWEIGGQNIPNDWMDIEEDRELNARTLPVRFGTSGSLLIMIFALAMAALLSLIIFFVAPAKLNFLYPLGAVFAAVYVFALPASRIWKSRAVRDVSLLFNRASYYPLLMFLAVMLSFI